MLGDLIKLGAGNWNSMPAQLSDPYVVDNLRSWPLAVWPLYIRIT